MERPLLHRISSTHLAVSEVFLNSSDIISSMPSVLISSLHGRSESARPSSIYEFHRATPLNRSILLIFTIERCNRNAFLQDSAELERGIIARGARSFLAGETANTATQSRKPQCSAHHDLVGPIGAAVQACCWIPWRPGFDAEELPTILPWETSV